MTRGIWNLLLIGVHSDCQRHSFGHALMHRVESLLTGRHARLLPVETSGLAAFKSTRAFTAGSARKEASIRTFYDTSEDKIVFRKALTPKSYLHHPRDVQFHVFEILLV